MLAERVYLEEQSRSIATRLRHSMLQKLPMLKVGDWVMYFRRGKKGGDVNEVKRGSWLGPARVLAMEPKVNLHRERNDDPPSIEDDYSVIWVVHGTRLIRCHPTQIRSSSQREVVVASLRGNIDRDSPTSHTNVFRGAGRGAAIAARGGAGARGGRPREGRGRIQNSFAAAARPREAADGDARVRQQRAGAPVGSRKRRAAREQVAGARRRERAALGPPGARRACAAVARRGLGMNLDPGKGIRENTVASITASGLDGLIRLSRPRTNIWSAPRPDGEGYGRRVVVRTSNAKLLKS